LGDSFPETRVPDPGAAIPRPPVAAGPAAAVLEEPEAALAYETGVEVQSRSQWQYARRRFMRHRLALVSLVLLLGIFLAGAFAPWVAPYAYDEIDLENASSPPTLDGHHIFGTDLIGRDYFSRVIFGIRTSEQVALIVMILATAIGVVVGALAGYYSATVDNILMRFTDLILTLPALAVLLTAAALLGRGDPHRVAIIIALISWTYLARIVRGTFLSLREKEYVEAAKAAGAGDLRIMVRHMLPNCIGPIVVSATLIVGLAILTESVLGFLGFGIQPPTPTLGKLIADGQGAGTGLWWLVTFPGLTIVLILLCVNFVGDGLRDALDPTQRRVRE
jgi:ABC-type dipeptide/oligopeptide/nickel transport system permease subunit